MNKIILGRFVQGNSLIHQLDARCKILLSFYFIIIIFLANNWQSYVLLAALVMGAVLLAQISIKFFWQGVAPLLGLILFTVGLQVLFTTGGHVYWHWGILNLTTTGIISGSYVFVRFMLIIFMSTLLTLTTAPLAIAQGFESLMQPLKKIKFPVTEVALMMSIALRFVPTLLDETQTIMDAQRSRGVDFANGSIKARIKAIVPLLVPLFVSALGRAEDLALAMEARGYRSDAPRSKYTVERWQKQDTLACGVFGLVTLVLIWVRG